MHHIRLPTIVVRGDILSSWLRLSSLTNTRLASQLGVTKGRVSQLLRSQASPSAHLIAKLLVLTNLPFDRLFKVVVRARATRPAAPGPSYRRAVARSAEPAGPTAAPVASSPAAVMLAQHP